MLDVVFAVFGDPTALLEALVQAGSGDDLEDWMVSAIVAGMAIPAGVVAVKLGFDRQRRSHVVEDTPTERVRSIAAGRTELKGVARPFEQTYSQPFAGGDCVYARWRVQEYVEEDPHDDENDDKTWETVASGTLGDHVVLEGDTGAIVLESPSMNFSKDAKTTKTRKANTTGLLDRLLGREPEIPDFEGFLREQNVSLTSNHKRRYQQWVLEEESDLYVLGQATPRDPGEGSDVSTDELAGDGDVLEGLAETYEGFRDDLVIERDDASGEYLVTDMSEAEMARQAKLHMLGLLAGGVVLVVAGLYFGVQALGQYGLV